MSAHEEGAGKGTSDLFFRRLREVAPDFERAGSLDIPGCTWTFMRRKDRLRQWLWYQQKSRDDAFLVELSWSCEVDDPTVAPIGGPSTPFTARGCRFRLGQFTRPGVDTWWPVGVGPPGPIETFARLLDGRPDVRVDVSSYLPAIGVAVEAVIEDIEGHALPYFARVAGWAAEQAQLRGRPIGAASGAS